MSLMLHSFLVITLGGPPHLRGSPPFSGANAATGNNQNPQFRINSPLSTLNSQLIL